MECIHVSWVSLGMLPSNKYKQAHTLQPKRFIQLKIFIIFELCVDTFELCVDTFVASLYYKYL